MCESEASRSWAVPDVEAGANTGRAECQRGCKQPDAPVCSLDFKARSSTAFPSLYLARRSQHLATTKAHPKHPFLRCFALLVSGSSCKFGLMVSRIRWRAEYGCPACRKQRAKTCRLSCSSWIGGYREYQSRAKKRAVEGWDDKQSRRRRLVIWVLEKRLGILSEGAGDHR